jgi:ATP/maltotriose-dependent transcriptional regulator MalT
VTESIPIILTKLYPPLARRNVFRRERLAALVRQCPERRLTLVHAGAGYGKTTLIANTLSDAGVPLLWYSLSRSDRDPVTFLSYLTEAFDRQWPGFAEAVRPTFASGQTAPVASFVAVCVNQWLACATGDFVLVIDDFQLVERVAEICEALDQLISHAPPQAHFVLATRAAPPFECLPRLRAVGEVLEIGEAELRFSLDEAAALANCYLKLNLPEGCISALVEQTEGWVLGLLLASQSVKAGGDVEGRLAEAAADCRVLFEYLTEEVLRRQPPALVDFLTSSAILSRLEPNLCDAALARSDSGLRLRELEQNCLFVVRTQDGWLRYHRLFRAFLLQHLAANPARLEALHRRAAAYFESAQDFETAVFHWLKGGAYREAARLVATLAAAVLRAGRADTFEFWLQHLPAEVLNEFLELLFRWGQMCETRVREAHRRQRAALLASLARDQLSAANTAAATTLYREALAIYEAEADRQGQLDTLLNPGAWLYHSLGDFTQALAVLSRTEQLALELDQPRQLAEVYNDMAVNLYFLGRYAESLSWAEKALALSAELKDAHQEAYALMNQANAWEATCGAGQADLYRQYQRALHAEQTLGNQRFVIAILVFMMMLARRGGDIAEAIWRGQQALPLATERGLRWLVGFVQAQLGVAQIWVDAKAARASLESAQQIFADCQDQYHLTVTHFWLAALYHSENDAAYLEHLRECLRLAVGHNYDCFFHAEQQASIPLLVSALEHDLWTAYVQPILVKFGSRAAGSVRPLLSHSNAGVRARAQSVLKEISISAIAPDARPASNGKARAMFVPPLVISGFGNFTVRRGGHLVEEREWGRRKCKRLLKYIAFSPDRTLPKDIAVDLLWGEADPQAANANFYRVLYNLRRVLEPLSPHTGTNYIVLEGGLIRLVAETVPKTDVDQFVEGVDEGRRLARLGERAAAHDKLAAAVALYADDLSTDDLYDDWIRPRREQLRDLYLSTLHDLAELATEAGQVEDALSYLRQAFRKDNTSEAACLNLMLALAKAGHRAEALQHYSACEKALAGMELSPSLQLRALQYELLSVSGIVSDWPG